jgi:ATP-dependent Clp protease ATP-binding subunit ClpA
VRRGRRKLPESAARFEYLRGLESHLRAHIRGQDHLIGRVAAVFLRGELGLASPERPRGSFLFVGPTGTGKSMTFDRAVNYVFGPGSLVVFDMSEYQDKSAVNKLLGEDRADVGLLGRALMATQRGGVLFDELEKAHPLVMDLFLQILWDGRITVATGETFRFANYYVGFTSNIGAADAMRMRQSRFASVEQAVMRSVEYALRPELVGRLDEKLVFARLTPEVQREICALEVAREGARLRGLGYDLEISREAIEFLHREGFHPLHGARPMRAAVERHLQQAVVDSLIARGFACGLLSTIAGGTGLAIEPS